jgi:hypothetical protein
VDVGDTSERLALLGDRGDIDGIRETHDKHGVRPGVVVVQFVLGT